MKIFILILSSFLFISCGADKLNKKNQTSNNTSFISAECQLNSSYAPVCGKINGTSKDFDHIDIANCMQATDITAGHCNCNSNQILVCGSDGQDHTECEAKQNNIAIVKYIPCAATHL